MVKKDQEIDASFNISHLLKRTPNLVPRSLVDEAEGEILQSKKISFS